MPLDEAHEYLRLNHDQVKALVRAGILREFRDAGVPNYQVDEVQELLMKIEALGPQTTFEQLVASLPKYGAKKEKTIGPADDDTLCLTEDPAIWQRQKEVIALRYLEFLVGKYRLEIFVDYARGPDELAKAMGVASESLDQFVKELICEFAYGMKLS